MARTRIGHFYIDETCIGCGACEHACPGKVDAIYKIEGDFTGRFAIVLEDCIDCGFCIPMCPVDCIHDARKEDIDADTESGWTKIRDLQAWAGSRANKENPPWLSSTKTTTSTSSTTTSSTRPTAPWRSSPSTGRSATTPSPPTPSKN